MTKYENYTLLNSEQKYIFFKIEKTIMLFEKKSFMYQNGLRIKFFVL